MRYRMVRLAVLCFALARVVNPGSDVQGNATTISLGAIPVIQNNDSLSGSSVNASKPLLITNATSSATRSRQHVSTVYKHSLGRLRSWPWPRSSIEITLPDSAAMEIPHTRPGTRSARGKLMFGSQLNQSLEDTSPLLNTFAEFRLPEEDFRNLRVSSFVDWNGDGVQDVLAMDVGFFDFPNDKNRTGPWISVYCMNKKVMTYDKCFSQRLDLVSAIKKLTTLGDDLQGIHVYVNSLVVSDFQRNNVLSLLLILRGNTDTSPQIEAADSKKNVFSLGPQEFSFLHFVRDGVSDDSEFRPCWMTEPGEGSSVPPIVVDLNWDGYLDLLGNDAYHPSRMIWINQRNGTFKAFPWHLQPGLFDFQNYSSTPKVDFSHESFTDQLDPVLENHTSSNRILSETPDGSGFFGKIGKAFQGAWFRMGFSRGNHRDAKKVDEESLLSRHASDRLPFAMPRQVRWAPRPLPLIDSTPLASIMGHSVVDMNGDCMADLTLVVESPDFEGRFELEIWLLEEDPSGWQSDRLDKISSTGDSHDIMPSSSVKWRMWRGQRILLPDGAVSVALDDFSSRGNVDLLVLACDRDDEINELAVLQRKFANRGTDVPAESDVIPFCRGLERMVLHKMFQPPLCVSKKLMPDPIATTCRDASNLCTGSAFGFGGVDDGMRRTGVSISALDMDETDEEGEPRMTLGAALPYAPPIITVQDIDKDGFLDILLLTVPRNKERGHAGGQLRILKNMESAVFPDQPDQNNLDVSYGQEYSPYDYMQNPYEGWWQHAVSLLSVCFTSISSISKNVYSKLFDPTKTLDDPFKARRFKAIHDIAAPAASLYAGGFIEDPLVTGTVSILTFSDFPHNLSSVHLFSPIAGNSFSTSPLGAPAEENFFLSVTVLSEVDESCLATGKSPLHTSSQPILGGVAAMTVSNYEGVKYPVRRAMSQISTRTQLVSRFLYFGLGRSSNYIEGIQLGTPFVTEYSPKCGAKNSSDTSHPGVFHKPFSSFNRRWVALIPNSDISVVPGVPRWNVKAWNLMLCVNPGQQASRILLGTGLALLVVGCINILLSRREKAIMNREQRGFRRRLLGI